MSDELTRDRLTPSIALAASILGYSIIYANMEGDARTTIFVIFASAVAFAIGWSARWTWKPDFAPEPVKRPKGYWIGWWVMVTGFAVAGYLRHH